MTPAEYARLKEIVAGALALPAPDRHAFLVLQCGLDAGIRQEAESLLRAVIHAEPLFEDPTLSIAGSAVPVDALIDGDDVFEGTDRYAVRRCIGAGGMGVVYEVDDRMHGEVVALKTLRRRSGDEVYQLKREFRNLADVAHRNLVAMFDLVVNDHHCFFTMELVHGVTFVDYVRQAPSLGEMTARARRVLIELIDGLSELHRWGLLHRDIKPSNVLVTAEGRVVVLDFGLTSLRLRDEIAGTPAYLAPERFQGEHLSEAGDWYSVGATLFHALTGRAPFEDSTRELAEPNRAGLHSRALVVPPELPEDLAAVCLGLLHPDPAARLTGTQALEQLAIEREDDRRSADVLPRLFVGRESSLGVLGMALADARARRSASVVIYGPSGIGKSALVQSFIDTAVDPDVLVLRSRCHEHEAIPYKGLDGIIDSVTRHLAALPPDELAHVMPADGVALARLFRVLRALGLDPERDSQVADDPVLLRQRAFSAFRELFRGLAGRAPVVVDIDDFHWADTDSVKWLTELMRPPGVPSLLLILSFRSEEIDAKPFLRALIERIDIGGRRAVPLMPMSNDEVARLVQALLPASTPDTWEQIAAASGGNPFLVEALAHHASSGAGTTKQATLEQMLQRRLDALPEEARVFLEALAVCGRPVPPSRIFEACQLDRDERLLVAQLKRAHLLRSSRSPERVELYHDRIRETLAAGVPPSASRQIHESMAATLVARADDDPEALFEHYQAAGDHERAAVQAAAAAAKANAVLAFDSAATFYRQALALHPRAEARVAWSAGLARALENAGRPADAANMYLDAAHHGRPNDRLEWRRKAAELLLVGGQIDRGLAVSAAVLKSLGLRLARGPRSALISLAVRRLQLRWRGLRFDVRNPAQIPPADLLRIDASWSISAGLAMVDPIRAAAFNVQQLLRALDVGDPYRVARALALEAGFSVIGFGAGVERSAQFSGEAAVLAEYAGQKYVAALTQLWTGIAAFLTGQWKQAAEACGHAVVTLRDECTGVLWELNMAHNFFLGALVAQGELREAARHLPGLLDTAQKRGNFYLELELRTRMILVWLAADDPDGAERMADEGIARWSQRGFQRQHYSHLLLRVQVALYRGRAREAWALMASHKRRLRRSLLLRVQHTRIESANYRARCALAMAAAGQDATRMRVRATREARRLLGERMPWSVSLAQLVLASVAYQEGHRTVAIERLHQAVDGFGAAHMRLYAVVCQRLLGGLVGGETGRTLRQGAESWMAEQAIRNPVAMSRLLAPGFPEEPR